MSNKKILFIVVFILLVITLSGCSNINKNLNLTTPLTSINSERIIPEGISGFFMEFRLVGSNTHMNFQYGTPYYTILQKETDSLMASVYIENMLSDTSIKFLILQGNNITHVSLDKKKWYLSVVQPVVNNSRGILNFYIKWKLNESDELIILPIPDKLNDAFSGSGVGGVMRYYINNGHESPDTSISINTNNNSHGYIPSLVWVDRYGNSIMNSPDSNDRSLSKYNKLLISNIPFDTEIDLLYVNENGDSILIGEDIEIKKTVRNQYRLIHIYIKRI
ncbi:hypothetical protein [Paenibacillus montanisoli]|uniref:Lipoprotein n=1 Tax=Paenibacillus montanisoli TaxID=2081970 RepID=A0A328TWD1_9BACL|nr:hypothetical protein [Paenibacillus montanisoli]RAP74799.1 hypothetical protein DL346_22440 [Paenibacillus montanisoli]